MKAEKRGFWESTATGALVIVALVAFGGALTGGLERREFGVGSRLGEAVIRVGMLIVAVVFGVWAFGRMRDSVTEQGVTDDPIYHPDVLLFIELQEAALAQIANGEDGPYATFVELLVDPARYRSRVVETIDTESNVIRQRVSIEYHLPSEAVGKGPVYLPVMHLPKGTLLDNFDLRDPGGNSLVDLAYEETIKIAAVGLRFLLMRVLGTGVGGPVEFLDPRAEKLELVLLGILAQRGRSMPNDANRAIEEAFESAAFKELIEKADPADVTRLRQYVLTLGVAHPIVAVTCPEEHTSGRLLLKYEQTIIPSSYARSPLDPLRFALGLRPRIIQIPLDLSRTAASYHLRVNASSSDQYLYKQALRCRHCKYLVRRSWRGREPAEATAGGCGHVPDGTSGDCHYRLRPRQGQSYLHLYMRGYASLPVPLRDLEVAMQFRETPPGSLASASVTSLAVSALIGVIGYLISVGHGVGNSDLAALILALPAIAASYFGFATDGDSLLRSSLAARLSFIASGVLSIVAAGVYLLRHTAMASAAAHAHGIRIDVALVTNRVWLILLGLAILNTLFVISRFVLRLDHYNRLMGKREPADFSPSYEMG